MRWREVAEGFSPTELKVDRVFYGGVAPCRRDDTLAARLRAVERVITATREQPFEPWSLRDMSRVAYVSPFHFNRVFHQITGLPPARFVGALRLEAAKRMLLTSVLTVTNICYEVGYSSIGTFTTRFTRLVGLGPREFRRFPERVSTATLNSICTRLVESARAAGRDPSLAGVVDSTELSAGMIFVGLFRSPVPQSRPVGGTLLDAPGPFCIGRVPDGVYHLLAASLPPPDDMLDYLLPGDARLLVGIGNGPVIVRGGKANAPARVTLRRTQLTDPPLLISLPSLLIGAANAVS